MKPDTEDTLENPVRSGAEGARYGSIPNLSGKRTKLHVHVYAGIPWDAGDTYV